jgi:hypothetical protein
MRVETIAIWTGHWIKTFTLNRYYLNSEEVVICEFNKEENDA